MNVQPESHKKTRVLLFAIVALALFLVGLVVFWHPETQSADPVLAGFPVPGSGFGSNLPTGGDFTLTGPDGPVSLHDYKNKIVVIYFGYTYCPDICPTSLALIGDALSKLDANELKQVQGLFVSLDPDRDTPERLRQYAPFFHTSLIGLSGNKEITAAVARQYGVIYRYHAVENGNSGDYSVDHSSATYLVAPDGRLVGILPHGTSSQAIVDSIRKLIRQTPS